MRRWRACGRTIESEHFVRVAAEFYGTIARFLEQFPRSGSHCPARMLSPACTATTHDVSAADAECSCTILRIHSGGSRRGIYPDDFHFEFFDSRWHVSIKSRTARLPCHNACPVHVPSLTRAHTHYLACTSRSCTEHWWRPPADASASTSTASGSHYRSTTRAAALLPVHPHPHPHRRRHTAQRGWRQRGRRSGRPRRRRRQERRGDGGG